MVGSNGIEREEGQFHCWLVKHQQLSVGLIGRQLISVGEGIIGVNGIGDAGHERVSRGRG